MDTWINGTESRNRHTQCGQSIFDKGGKATIKDDLFDSVGTRYQQVYEPQAKFITLYKNLPNLDLHKCKI